ncbi:C1 family peptidase [Plantactinospora sp. GCM10030261]|uniref:C1 family peptidase n=1 Tax=Plantactinospora sp. GCM10030261 TaxID=3273420 RepID=UPI00361AC60B
MEEGRRLAVDPPRRSAGGVADRRLLGRIYRPDPRDWSLSRLLEIAEPPDSIRQSTIEQVLAETTYFTDWRSYLVFWRWLKKQQEPAPPAPTDRAPAWELPIQLDQGDTGHCVGFGWAGWVDATPVPGTYQNADAHALYYECKIIDGEPGEENGSTVRSGALALRNRGRVAAFGFADNLTEIDEWINAQGTVVVGTEWTQDMFTPDGDGYVKPTGSVQGGHCYLMLDRLDAEDAYLFQNSWGDNWGQSGRFKIKSRDFEGLLASQGEACCAAELPH